MSVVYESNRRMGSVRYSEGYEWLFVSQGAGGGGAAFRFGGGGGGGGGTSTQYAVRLDQPDSTYTITEWDRSDFYANPGSLVSDDGWVEIVGEPGNETVFLTGTIYHEDPLESSPQSFMDRVSVRTGEKERVYESSNDGQYERITTVLDAGAGRLVVSRETPTEIRQSYLVDGDTRTQLTSNIDYTPDITNAPRQRFTVERPDGFRFLVNVTLPPDFVEGERRPAMFWFYPREYQDQESYDERGRTYNKNSFPNFGTRSMDTSSGWATSWSNPTRRSWGTRAR